MKEKDEKKVVKVNFEDGTKNDLQQVFQ